MKISKRYSSHSYGSFSSKPFLNIPCNSPYKTCLLAFSKISFFLMIPVTGHTKVTYLYFLFVLPIVIIIIIMILFQPTFSECSLWQSLQKLLMGILKIKIYFFNKTEIEHCGQWGISKRSSCTVLIFFPLKSFVNVPCDRHRKRYILGFWNSI